ncbi:4-hydroxy-tetrahydrodipicolinate synthase [Corynebacterium casei]|uniref:4-hydroxy-tetrahydrodipicolinate synthase n=1 Tax=Corynebacterium casei UCMA 3821 TaxID=1110505 RepID=G7HYX8_9CORY|nr:4-hydroxy-tetrahydrodipicolinate synthase [Corynebacterium casei]CCE55393.1 dihydrodipicolinate synthase family protein [Corynebacterium casei UCMA 3821]
MTKKVELRGVLTALSIPFADNQDVAVDLLKKVVDRSINGGINGVVVGGSTGEFASLSSEERIELVDTVVSHTAGRVPVIAQTGATTTREAIRLSKKAQDSGADVLMLVTPYYEPLSLDETTNYIRTVADAVELPVMLYNIPGATGVNLDADSAGSLAREFDNIHYIKDSSANWEQALQLIHHHSDALDTIIGWDSYIYSALVEGAAGVMAGAANVIPEEIVAVVKLIQEGQLAEGLSAWNEFYPVIDAMISEPFIAAVKKGLDLQGFPIGLPRAPMADISEEATARVEKALKNLHAYAQ